MQGVKAVNVRNGIRYSMLAVVIMASGSGDYRKLTEIKDKKLPVSNIEDAGIYSVFSKIIERI